MTTIDQTRLATAVTAAVEAFWAKIAEAYPEATHGDLDIGVATHFDQVATAAATRWLQTNVRPAPTIEAGEGAPQGLIDACRRVYDASDVAGDETDVDAAVEAIEERGADAALHHSGGGTMHALGIVEIDGVRYFIAAHSESVEAFGNPPSADLYACWAHFYSPEGDGPKPLVRLSLP
jgi:hypothetical protein